MDDAHRFSLAELELFLVEERAKVSNSVGKLVQKKCSKMWFCRELTQRSWIFYMQSTLPRFLCVKKVKKLYAFEATVQGDSPRLQRIKIAPWQPCCTCSTVTWNTAELSLVLTWTWGLVGHLPNQVSTADNMAILRADNSKFNTHHWLKQTYVCWHENEIEWVFKLLM